MSDYPDPDEEYELMYADDLELLREQDDNLEPNVVLKKPMPAKRSLDFSSPLAKKIHTQTNEDLNDIITDSQVSLTPNLQPLEEELTSTVSNKRTADELFGDINDIDFDAVDLPSKKQKTEEENDLELINKILEARKLKQLLLEPSSAHNVVKPAFDAKENLSLDIPKWAFIPLTSPDGDRIYVKLDSEEAWENSLSSDSHPSLQSLYTKTWDEAREILQRKEEEKQTPEENAALEVDINGNCLWVDKYRPHSYVDLLSEEPVNRALLHWLHLWDKIVFKKEVKSTEPLQRNTFSKRAGQFQLTNKWKGKREAEPEMDEDGRPHYKVALLCGPPGVGKTTLAHLLARMAGYRPVEVNASDERSTEAFRTALHNATLMRSVLDAEKRPNCLILDEIDGAPLPTVELLVKWCTATSADEKKKKAKSQPLRRPVIAICNDLYATSLRPLRPVSMVIQVGAVSVSRLCARLSQVAELECVRVSGRALQALANRAAGDARAAILALAFLKDKLKMEDVENIAIGTKDCSQSLMQALNAVFTTNDTDPERVMKIIQSCGEYDRLIEGIFENYLTSRVDSQLLIANETLSWLRLYDTVYAWTLRTQNYSLYGLLPICVFRCHRVLATRTGQKLRFPTQAQEMYRKKVELESIVNSVWRGSSGNVTRSRLPLLLDVIPLLPALLSPSLHCANIQLCSGNERKALRSCAGAMCDYSLQYVQRRGADGYYSYELEPDIYRVAFYGNEERMKPPPPIRHAISREQQLEIIRRNEEMVSKTTKSKSSDDAQQKTTKKDITSAPESRLPNHLQRLQPKVGKKAAPQVHKDFFGRVVPLSQIQRSDAVPDVISSSSVFYQYQEGFNNAVRRSVRTKDLL